LDLTGTLRARILFSTKGAQYAFGETDQNGRRNIEAFAALHQSVIKCVTGYVWLSIELGPAFGGLAMVGVFLLIGVLSATASAIARDRTRQRAVLERAARAQGTRALIDPKVLSIAMQAGRALGRQRLIPLALLSFLAAQWVQEARRQQDTRERAI
jgi:hypothetical protein